MTFTCIGYDIKFWPPGDVIGIDQTSWETHEFIYDEVMKKFNLQENEYQLINIPDEQSLLLLCEYIGEHRDSDLVAVEIPCAIANLNSERSGYTAALGNAVPRGMNSLGYDVCDINGLFSALHHPRIISSRKTNNIIRNDYVEALEVALMANFIDKDHSPYCVARILSLKGLLDVSGSVS
ncbi:hypothetical protein [Pseudomonas paralcaligenes]|uniref:hypothetical protein n=1 Tax=Pseudomonas paralcaligenes TaxID=2772558 RepID=UPI001C811927|nr:hypothetical protein [Pseudomonas paralcaligenes]